MRSLMFVAALAAVFLAGTAQPARSVERSAVLVAGRVLRPDGSLDAGVAVIVRDGKIRRLIPANSVDTDSARRFGAQTVLCPGLIDLFSTVGAGGRLLDTQPVIDPDASAAGGLDPTDPLFRQALEAGITAAMVAPSPGNLVCGVAVTTRTYLPAGQLDLLRDDGPLVLAFGEGVWRRDRPPTSRAGAVHELRRIIDNARRQQSHPRLNALLAGELDGLVVCPHAVDVDDVLATFGDGSDKITLVQSEDAIELIQDLAGTKPPVIVGPYDMDTPRRELLGAAALSSAGMEIAFAGGFPERAAQSTRISAAIAVRNGMAAKAARRAITVGPAKAAGVADRIGAIRPGLDADLVVFSADPLRLDARVLEVYVQGVRVYSAANASGGGT